jgi:PAS domain S-box-containing protein
MRQAFTPQEVFESIGNELKKEGFGCAIFRTNHDLSQMALQYINYESKGIAAVEKLLKTKTEDFSVSIKPVDTFQKAIWDQETVFDDDVGTSICQLLPKPMRALGQQIMRLLNIQRAINAPLIVDQQMMGMFSIQSDGLTTEDISIVTAFAHQIAANWQKARLVQDLELSFVAQLQTEESLRESEEKYRTLFDLSPEAIVVIGLNGIVLDANKAITNFGDVKKEDIIGRSFLDLNLFDENRSQYFLDLFSQLIIGDVTGPLEFQLNLRENFPHWIEAHPALLRDGNDVLALQLILRDITDRKEAEEAIQQRVDELELVHQTSQKLATASLSVNEVAEIAVQQLSNVMVTNICTFSMLDLNRRKLTVISETSHDKNRKMLLSEGEIISFDDYPVIERAITTTLPSIISPTDTGYVSEEIAYLQEIQVATLVLIPFSVKSRVIGVMELGFINERHFSASQLNFAMTLANQIAVALDNARLFEAAQQEIFDRIQAEMALQESEEQFRSIFENAVMGFYRSTPSGEILMANPALIRMLGYETFEELAERNLEVAGFAMDSPRSEFTHQIKKTGQVIGLEATWLRKDNTPLYVQESAKAIYDNDDKVIFYEGTVEDITQRKQIEALQHISEERFNKAFNTSPLAMGIQGADGDQRGVWLLINDAFSQITGYKRSEVLGRTTSELKLYANLQEQEEAVNLFLEQGYVREYKFELRRKSGERRHGLLWSEATPVGDESNVLVVIQDITAQQKAERDRHTLIEFQQLVAMLSARFINLSTVKIEEEITYALKIIAEYAQADAGSVWMFSEDKSTGSKAFGWPNPEKKQRNQNVSLSDYAWMFDQLLTGKMISISSKADYPLEDVGLLFDAFDLSAILAIPLITEGDVIGTLSIYMRKVEKRWSNELESLLKIIGDIIVNALERKRQEESIHQLNEELELRVIQRTQQLEAANKELEAFAYSVSHDLRAPLRAIDGFSLALIEDYNDQLGGDAQNYLERVRTASQRMGQLIDDLLKLSRVTRSEMDHNDVDLSALFSEIIAELQETEPKQEVEIIIQPDLVALGDKHLLRIMLTNLCTNAWKFTRKKEQVQIEFGCLEAEETPTFFIRDNGAGFDMTYADKLFGTFQRLHTIRDFEGTGIGLATVKRIIQRHGGRVWAEGEIDHGATFYFTIGETP